MCRLCCIVDVEYSGIKRDDDEILDCYGRCGSLSSENEPKNEPFIPNMIVEALEAEC